MKSMHKKWNITILFIIHVDFDHAWAEHYPVILIKMSREDQRQGVYKLLQGVLIVP